MSQALKAELGGLVPLEVYLRSSEFEPDAEYVDGRIEERSMGEIEHAAWQRALMKWFLLHEDEWNIFVFPELRVQVKPGQFRVPDVTVIDQEHSLAIERYVNTAPVAVFEILSPEDTMVRVLAKLEEYSAMGIGQIWLINPDSGIASRYRNHQLTADERFIEAKHRIDFAMNEIKALLPKRLP